MPRYLLICTLLASHLHAESVVVTLASAGDRIRSQNPDLVAARLRIEEAVGRARQSGRLPNPEFESSIEHHTASSEGRIEVGLSQRFPVTGRLRMEKEISATGIQAAEAEVREAERRIIAEARECIVRILAARERGNLLRQQMDMAGKFAEFLAEIAAKGEGSSIDAGQAKLETKGLALELRKLETKESTLTSGLKPLLGMGVADSLVVSGSLHSTGLPTDMPDPARRPDFQMARIEEKAAEQGVELERMKRREDIEGGLFAAVERTEDAPNGSENESMIGVRFKIPLPFWNKNEGAIQEAETRQERMRKESAALAEKIRIEARSARDEMVQWSEMLDEFQNKLLPLADDQVVLSEAAYRNGQSEIQSVLRSHEKRLEIAVSRLEALMELNLARIRYEAALGKP